MTILLSLLARKARMLGLRNAIDDGGGSALFYSGAPPGLPDGAAGATLLGSVAFSSPSGVIGQSDTLATLTLTTPKTGSAVASGLIGWVRLVNGAGDGIMDLPAGLDGSGAPVIVNALQIYAGGEITLVSCVIAQ